MSNKKIDVHFSSKSDNWSTPQYVYDQLSNDYGPFILDVCADEQNAKCENYIDEEMDGLKTEWYGKCFMNPPYSSVSDWMEKAYKESLRGVMTVCLVPARTDTKWFHKYVMEADVVEFIQGRIKFGDSTNSAPFPSMVVVFRSPLEKQDFKPQFKTRKFIK
jgi:phage N-6-adenine-methyltransferase